MTKPRKATVLRFVILLGVVNLFADLTYEGARSITGPFLAQLGATAAIISIVSGAGEFLGYAARRCWRIKDRISAAAAGMLVPGPKIALTPAFFRKP